MSSISSRRSTKSSAPPAAWRQSRTPSSSPQVPASISHIFAEPEKVNGLLTAEGTIANAPSLKELNIEIEMKRQAEAERVAAMVPDPVEITAEPAVEDSVQTLRPEPNGQATQSAPDVLQTSEPVPVAPEPELVPIISEDDVADIPAPPPAYSSWFGSIGISGLPLVGSRVPTPQQPASQPVTSASSITSVDDSVPSPRRSPPPSIASQLSPGQAPAPVLVPSGSNGVIGVNGEIPTLSSLNPSTSRFTLAIPLLGRPKVPLDQVLHDQATLANGGNMTAEEQNSWWSYVGWNNPVTTYESTSSSDTKKKIEPSPEVPKHESESTESTLEPLPPPTLEPPSTLPSSASVISAAHSSSWLAPWTWAASASTSSPDLVTTKSVKTEAEEIKDAALGSYERERRDSAPPAINIQFASPPTTPEQGPTNPDVPARSSLTGPEITTINPVESSMMTNSTSWANFFLGRGLAQKTIKDGVDPDSGMEVMDVPDDIPETTDTTPTRGRPVSLGFNTPSTSSLRSPKAKPPGTQTETHTPETSPSPRNRTPAPSKKPAAVPLTNSDSVKRDNGVANITSSVAPPPSPAGSSSGTKSPNAKKPPLPPPKPPRPNLMLPTWSDTFLSAPRSILPPESTSSSALSRSLKYVNSVLFQQDTEAKQTKRQRRRESELMGSFGLELPRAFEVLNAKGKSGSKINAELEDVLQGVKRVMVIGVHGWFPGGIVKTLTGEPTGTSEKFADMMIEALENFQKKHGVKLEKITRVPLEGQGTISKRSDKLYNSLMENKEWVAELHVADAIIVAAHSQGSIVSVHLLDRLVREGHILTSRTPLNNIQEAVAASGGTSAAMGSGFGARKPQRVVCLAMCGIHLGPLRYLSSSSLLQQYFQYFETNAARELFEFQDTESAVSQAYMKSLANVLHHGTKMVYVASLNDQVVGLYSGLFTAASHPLILRGLFIDGEAYQSMDFLSNLLVLLLRVLNSGISDSGLLAHLSEATAGTLNGVGHSTIYDELAVFQLAVDYLFLVNDGDPQSDLVVDSFNANSEQNDYEIPWSLRDVIADERVAYFFSKEILQLRDEFRDWHPKTAILRDVKKKLQPIQRLPKNFTNSVSASKLGPTDILR